MDPEKLSTLIYELGCFIKSVIHNTDDYDNNPNTYTEEEGKKAEKEFSRAIEDFLI